MTMDDSQRDKLLSRMTEAQKEAGQALWDEFGASDPLLVEDTPDIRKIARVTAAFFLEIVKTGVEFDDAYMLTDSYLVHLMFSPDHPHLTD